MENRSRHVRTFSSGFRWTDTARPRRSCAHDGPEATVKSARREADDRAPRGARATPEGTESAASPRRSAAVHPRLGRGRAGERDARARRDGVVAGGPNGLPGANDPVLEAEQDGAGRKSRVRAGGGARRGPAAVLPASRGAPLSVRFVGEELRADRRRARLSIEALAHAARTNERWVRRLERGEIAEPKPSRVLVLRIVLDAALARLGRRPSRFKRWWRYAGGAA